MSTYPVVSLFYTPSLLAPYLNSSHSSCVTECSHSVPTSFSTHCQYCQNSASSHFTTAAPSLLTTSTKYRNRAKVRLTLFAVSLDIVTVVASILHVDDVNTVFRDPCFDINLLKKRVKIAEERRLIASELMENLQNEPRSRRSPALQYSFPVISSSALHLVPSKCFYCFTFQLCYFLFTTSSTNDFFLTDSKRKSVSSSSTIHSLSCILPEPSLILHQTHISKLH